MNNQVPDWVEVEEIVCFVDSTNSLGIEEVSARPELFTPYKGPEINYGHLRDALWVRIALKNRTDSVRKVYLSSDQVILEDIRFYTPDSSGYTVVKSSWGLPAVKKETPSYLHAFSASLLPFEEKTFYYRIKNDYQVVRLPLHLFSNWQFNEHYSLYLFLDGLVIMALITSILYATYNLFFSRKDRILYYYLLYAFNFLTFYYIRIASPAHITEAYPQVLNYFVNIFILTSTYAFVKFGVRFIDPENEDGKPKIETAIDNVFRLTVLVSLFPQHSGSTLFNSVKLTFFVGAILYLIWYMVIRFRKSLLTRIYFFMGMPLIVSGLVEGLTNIFGLLKIPNQFFEAFRISICVEMLYILFAYLFREKILTTAVANKLKQTELKLLRSQIDAQEAEQKRIAGDLHDDLGGTLSTLKRLIYDNLLNKANKEEAEKIKTLTQKAGDDLRRISHALMPPDFEMMGLVDSIKEFARANQTGEREFRFLEHGEAVKLETAIELNIYRIISEIIQNINKHSPATKVSIQFLWSKIDLTVMIEDNGSTFRETTEGLGMKNMRMRTENIGGVINFDSNDEGSTITLEVPLK